MNEYPFHKFINLIEYDRSIVILEKEKLELEKQLEQRQHEFNVLETSLKNTQAHVHNLRKEVDTQEREMATFDSQEKAKRARLENVQNQREYESLKHEIDDLKQKQVAFEDTLIQAWKVYETAERELQEKKAFTQEKMGELDVVIKEHMQKIEESSGKIAELMAVRKEKEEGIPQEWLDKYTAMRSKVNNPVVPIDQESCTACFYKVSQKDLQELRKAKLIVCRDCFRLLYSEQAVRASQAGAAQQ